MRTDQPPVLTGTTCTVCGRVAFPWQSFGCERCGAHSDEVHDSRLSGSGTVLTGLTVHEHPNRDLPLPAVVATIQLDEGPVIRALLREAAEPGAPVAAVENTIGLTFAAKEMTS